MFLNKFILHDNNFLKVHLIFILNFKFKIQIILLFLSDY